MKDLRVKLLNLEKEHLENIRVIREEDWSKINSIEFEKSEVFIFLIEARKKIRKTYHRLLGSRSK